MVLFDWPTRAKARAKMRAEVEAEVREAWWDWTRRRDEAREKGEEFNEPPPGTNSDQQIA